MILLEYLNLCVSIVLCLFLFYFFEKHCHIYLFVDLPLTKSMEKIRYLYKISLKCTA